MVHLEESAAKEPNLKLDGEEDGKKLLDKDKMSPRDIGEKKVNDEDEASGSEVETNEINVNEENSSLLLRIRRVSPAPTNGKDCSFTSETFVDDNLSDVSDESMTLQLSEPEDDDERPTLTEKDVTNVTSNNTETDINTESKQDKPETIESSDTTENDNKIEPVEKVSEPLDGVEKNEKMTISDKPEIDLNETDSNQLNKGDDDENSSENDGLSLLEPLAESNLETDLEKEIDETEIDNERNSEDNDNEKQLLEEDGNEEDFVESDKQDKDQIVDKSDDIENTDEMITEENNDPESLLNLNDSNEDGDNVENVDVDEDAQMNENKKKVTSVERKMKKKHKYKIAKNKKIKISKSLMQKWKKSPTKNKDDETTEDNEIDIDEVPLLLRSASTEALDEIVSNDKEMKSENVEDDDEKDIKTEMIDDKIEIDDKIDIDEKDVDEKVDEKDGIKLENDTDKKEINEQHDEDKKDFLQKENDNSKKRVLETNDEPEIETKKIKVDMISKTEKKNFLSLDKFREFMKDKMNNLSRKHLEEFCMQKMFEVVAQNSELGELRHQFKLQEQMLENWRNKAVSLSKQCRDLEIVKCRLIQDMRAKEKEGGKVSETMPVKITRSVGLQVCLQTQTPRPRLNINSNTNSPSKTTTNITNIINNAPNQNIPVQRKARVSLPPRLPNNPIPPIASLNRNPNVPPMMSNSPINKTNQIKTIKTILPTKDQQNSLLSKVLQKPLPPPSNGPQTSNKKAPEAAPKAVIDLTDEDETSKTSNPNSNSSSTTNAPTNSVRLVQQQQLSNTSIASNSGTPLVATSMPAPRLTYLVTSGQQPQQVMLHTFATSTAQARPGQVRNTIMFKPLTPNAGPPRMNSIRFPASPVVVNQNGRPGPQIRIGNIQSLTARPPPPPQRPQILKHPAPLPGPPPLQPSQPSWKAMPPKPALKISRVGDGIVLSWKILTKDLTLYEEIASYQLYAYQETNAPPSTDMWRKVGDVKALALPMACTLTQFTDGNKYHFAVRAVDVKSRVGPFSQPEQIMLS